MKKKDLVKLLKSADFTMRQGKGDHEVWSKGSSIVVITDTREISPALTRQALKAIDKEA